jgi:hypothetical protein
MVNRLVSLKGNKKMKDAILDKWYTYNPDEFMPVYSGLELINGKQYRQYKTKQIIKAIGRHIQKTANK